MSASVGSFPAGYEVRNVNYGIELIGAAFPDHLESLVDALDAWRPSWSQIRAPGGGKSQVTAAFERAFEGEGWLEKSFELETRLDDVPTIARTHKLDLFKPGSNGDLPGVGVELEWNNKDEFFDRDLINFEALHRARGLAVGVIVTRGPTLQAEMRAKGLKKFEPRSTHWEKLAWRLDVGRGGGTPMIALGIEASRVRGR